MARRRTAAKEDSHSGGDTRQQILDAAEHLLYERGYHGMTMGEIAKQIGVRQAALYYHFPQGKEQLCLEVAHRVLDTNGRGIAESIARQKTARDRLKAVATWVFSRPVRADKVLKDMARFIPEEHQNALMEHVLVSLFAPVHAVLEKGIQSGELRPHDTAAVTWIYLSMLNGFESSNPQIGSADSAGVLVDILIDGIHA